MSIRFVKLVGFATTHWIPIESITSIVARGYNSKPAGWIDEAGAEVFIKDQVDPIQLRADKWQELSEILSRESHISEIYIQKKE